MLWIFTPKTTQNLARFDAADPWNGNQTTAFQLDRCFKGGFVPDWAAFDEQSIPHHYAIKSSLEAEHRVLPDSLAGLWRDKKLPAERLPMLLKGLEPDLKRSDYFRLMTLNRMQRAIRTGGIKFLGWMVGGFLMLGGFALLFMPPPDRQIIPGSVMIVVGPLLIMIPIRIVRGWQARRKQQTEWALSQGAR